MATSKDTGVTLYHHGILDSQVRQVVERLSPAHALALLVIHRLTSGYRRNTTDASATSMGAVLRLSRTRAHQLLLDLEAEKIITIERRRAKNNALGASLVRLTEAWRVPLPYRRKKLKGYVAIFNTVLDHALREVVADAGVRAGLVYFLLQAHATIGVASYSTRNADLMRSTRRCTRCPRSGRGSRRGYGRRWWSSRPFTWACPP